MFSIFLVLIVGQVFTIRLDFHTVAIVGTNDIHGSALPSILQRSDTNETYTHGGLEFMAQMIQTVKDQFKGQFIYLDAGDQFQGGIQSSPTISKGQIMNEFYNTMSVDASAIGNHEFDFGPNFLFSYWKTKKPDSPNLAANLKSQKGEQNFLPLQKGEKLIKLQSGIRIGVIGLATVETPSTTNGFSNGQFSPYQFLNYTDIVIAKSQRLRTAGANAVLILSHVGNNCNTTNKFGIWNKDSVQEGTCLQDEITKLMDSLPNGTVDGIVQGHRHRFSHHYIKGIPVMGVINGGFYFNIMYLKFHNFQLYDTKIQGPIPVCERVFQKSKTCNYLSDQELKTAGNLVQWKFHGKLVTKHKVVQKLFQKWMPMMKPYYEKLAISQIKLVKELNSQSELGNLITNLMHSAVSNQSFPIDFVIVNPHSFRTFWAPGIIQYQHFYNMFPFNNTINSFEMTGKELLDTLNILQSGPRGFYQTYGISTNVSLSKSGVKTLIGAKFFNNTDIIPQNTYRGLTTNFLINGGDDFKDVIGVVYNVRKQKVHGDVKDLLKPQLIKLGKIRANMLIDPLHPRLTIINN